MSSPPTSPRRSSSASGSPSRRRCPGSRSAPRAPSTPAAVESLGERMAAIPDRRGPVIGFSLLAWLVLLALLAAASRGGSPGRACGWPASPSSTCRSLLLLGAALEPGQGVEQLLALFGAPLLAAADPGDARRLPRAGRGGGADGPRLRGRRRRRLAAHLALAARAEPGPRRPLLRNRQRARGAARRPRRRRHRGGADRLRATGLEPRADHRVPRHRARLPPSSSPPAASAPTSAPRSSCRWAPRSPPRPSAGAGAAPCCSRSPRRWPPSPCWRWSTSCPAPTPT